MAGRADRFLVVDVETTGLYNLDRVVEVAAVTVSPSGEIIDEWDSLVNPERDIGPTHLHGVTASMVSAAPRFQEVAEALARRVDGSILVAHNLAFDSRMLGNEYKRLGAELDPGQRSVYASAVPSGSRRRLRPRTGSGCITITGLWPTPGQQPSCYSPRHVAR